MLIAPRLRLRLLMVLLLALAGAATGWAPDKMASPAEQLTLERFLLAGGSMADICADTGAPGQAHGHAHDGCCLPALLALPATTLALPVPGTRIAVMPGIGPVIEAALQDRWPDAIGRAPPLRA